MAVGSRPQDRSALAAPFQRLDLAGEATSKDIYATVHEAYNSG